MKSSITINLDTYSCKLVIIVTDKLKSETSKIFKKYNIISDSEGDDEGIVILANLDKYYLLIDIYYLSHNTIAHEIYHAVVAITEDRGINDEEAQAWLCGHLAQEMYKFLNRKKFKIK
jgi:hypothetical protein